jgi:hypothetical protein
VLLVEPPGARAVASDHRQELAQVLAVAMLDHGLGSVLERPAVVGEPDAQVDVAGGADPLREPARLLEGLAADGEVPGRRRPAALGVEPPARAADQLSLRTGGL